MDRSTFEARLRTAAQSALQFGRLFVQETLPDEVVFLVNPNQSYDGNPRVGDEVVFPDERLGNDQHHGPWSAGQVVDFLWRQGKVPEWIDIAVESVQDRHTVLGLLCCGRFTAQEELLYYRDSDAPGFGIKGPRLPPSWVSIEESEKFPLDWWRRSPPDWTTGEKN